MEEYSAVSEPQRLALHAAARRTLGEEEADTLMALSPPANTDIATRQDIDVLRSEMKGEFPAFRAEMKGEFAAVRAEMKGGFEAIRGETAAAIEQATNRSLRWMVGVMVVLHGATVGLLTLTLG